MSLGNNNLWDKTYLGSGNADPRNKNYLGNHGLQVGKGLITDTANGQVFVRLKRQPRNPGSSVDEVAALPPIPTEGYQKVFWYSSSYKTGGTATTSQLWEVYAGQTAWTACQFLTADSGMPVTP